MSEPKEIRNLRNKILELEAKNKGLEHEVSQLRETIHILEEERERIEDEVQQYI